MVEIRVLNLYVIRLKSSYFGPLCFGQCFSSIQVASALGIALFPMIGKVVQGWRILTILVSVLGVLLSLLLLLLPESPRWLLAQNREREVRKVGEIKNCQRKVKDNT